MITLYTANTGNGHRVSIMLEEVGLPYRVVKIDFAKDEHRGEALKAVNPMGQIPAIIDEDGPDGTRITLSESAAILRYLARKSGRLLPTSGLAELEADRWTAICAGGLSAAPTTIFFSRSLGEENHAGIIAKQYEVIGRYLSVMDERLSSSPYLADDYLTYVDILGFSIVNGTLRKFDVDVAPYPAVAAWAEGMAARPAVQRGLAVPR